MLAESGCNKSAGTEGGASIKYNIALLLITIILASQFHLRHPLTLEFAQVSLQEISQASQV